MKTTTVINIKDAPNNWQEDLRYYYCGRLTHYNNIHNFGNPYRVYVHGTRENCIKKFKADLDKSPTYQKLVIRILSGKILLCHCAPKPCHAQILADYCNANQADIISKLQGL